MATNLTVRPAHDVGAMCSILCRGRRGMNHLAIQAGPSLARGQMCGNEKQAGRAAESGLERLRESKAETLTSRVTY